MWVSPRCASHYSKLVHYYIHQLHSNIVPLYITYSFPRHAGTKSKRLMLDFSSISVRCDSDCDIDLDVPIGSSTFNHTKHWISESRPSCSLSKQKTEVLCCSVTLTGPLCQSHRAALQTSAPTLLSHTVGAEKRCQTI